MATYTTKYSLKKPGLEDFGDIADINANMDIIDAELAKKSNENLLINWDFRNPVNQRGQSEYSGITYTVDMWQLNVNHGKLNVNDGYITLTNTAASGAEYLRQGFERNFETGDVLTLSAEIRGNGSGQLFLGNSTDGANIGGYTEYTATSDWQIITFTKTLESTLPKWWVIQTTGQNTYIDIRRVKLELGSVSTLQNDPPADKAEQENLCARFGSNGEFITGPLYSNKNLLINWDFRNPVNTGGLATYSSRPTQIMTIDKWKMWGATVPMWTVTVADGGLNLAVGTAISNILNYLNTNDLDGKTFTITLLVDNVYYKSSSFVWDSTAGYTQINNFSNGFRISYNGTSNYVQVYNLSGSGTALVQAVKLELGSVSTLMNDGLANRAEQESLCARFDYSTGDLITGGPIPTSGVKNIQVSTTDLTPGTSTLATGTLYLVYE